MKTMKFLSGAVLILTVCFSSCRDNGYSLGKVWISIATVQNPENNNYFFFTLDDGTRMWTSATNVPDYKPKDGQRIIANYTILSDIKEGAYDHDVKLNAVYSVLTKDIFNITDATRDSIGDDPVKISDIWVGSDYLNVEFKFNGHDKVHYINLVNDSAKVYTDSMVHLEFRHNANKDTPNREQYGVASFRLKPLQKTGVDSLALVIHTHEYPSDRKEYQRIYRFTKSDTTTNKTFDNDSDFTKNIE
jgi:hypothetical protein